MKRLGQGYQQKGAERQDVLLREWSLDCRLGGFAVVGGDKVQRMITD